MATDMLTRWLSLRVRLIGIGVFVMGSLLPPYAPSSAYAEPEVSTSSPQFLLVEDGFIMKSASISQRESRRAYAEGIIHTVKEGESVGRLADRYGINAQTIRWANDLSDEAQIQPGDDVLVLPVDGVLHTVNRGQSLTRIAELYGVPAEEIALQNRIQRGFILAGQELIIPGGVPIIQKQVVAAVVEPPPGPAPDAGDIDESPAPTPAPAPSRSPPPPKEDPLATTSQAGFTRNPTTGVLQKPCSAVCFITQYYRAGHYALDMQEKGGGPIFASEAGTVTRSETGWNGGYGSVIEIDHGNGLVTLYAHNKELLVSEGDRVKRGQQIAWMGNTGLVYGATGIHVHYEVRLRGIKKNPLLYIQ